MLKRRILMSKLQTWKLKTERKPLLLLGARQVGKTTLMKQFGQMEFKDVAYFNFDEESQLDSIFKTNKNIDSIILQLSAIHGKVIKPNDCLIIFDEIQENPEAINSLKYFKENASSYHVIGAGSLLGITIGNGKGFPVGMVELLDVFPLSFLEYLESQEESLIQVIEDIKELKPLPLIFHTKLNQHIKNYFITGGMPEAVTSINKGFDEVDAKLREIDRTYYLDFSKHSKSTDIPKIAHIWNSLPSQLSKENKKFLYQAARSGARARSYEDALRWLELANMVIRVNQITKPELPLTAYKSLNVFKIYMHDIGLLRYKSSLHPELITEGNKLFTEFKGALTENYVVKTIHSIISNKELFYWSSEGRAEIDLILQFKNQTIPIEVKSSENNRSKSLQVFEEKYKPKLKIRFSTKNLNFDNNTLELPLYLADLTIELIKKAEEIN